MTRHKRSWTGMAGVMLGFVLLFAMNAAAQTWQAGGSGSPTDPYKIVDIGHLNTFRTNVNNDGNGTWKDKYWKLTADITIPDSGWVQIGNTNNRRFRGYFDGDGHTITFASAAGSPNWNGFGLFGTTEGSSSFRNLKVTYNSRFHARQYCGGLIGNALGTKVTIENVHILFNGTVNIVNNGESAFGGMIGRTVDAGAFIHASSVRMGSSNPNIDIPANYDGIGGVVGIVHRPTSQVEFDGVMADVRFYNTRANAPRIGGFVGYFLKNDGTGSSNYHRMWFKACFSNVRLSGTETYDASSTGQFVGAALHLPNKNHELSPNRYLKIEGWSWSGASWEWGGRAVGTEAAKHVSTLERFYRDPPWTAKQVYEELERRTFDNKLMSDSDWPDEIWGLNGSTKYPTVNRSGYLVKVKLPSKVNSTGHTQEDGSDRYVHSNTVLTLSHSDASDRVRVSYSFNRAYHRHGDTTSAYNYTLSGNSLTARASGTVSATLTNIPYPISPTLTFNQWGNGGNGSVTVSWTYNNPQNVSGRFYIYRRERGATDWGASPVTNIIADNSSNRSGSYVHNLAAAGADLYKTFEYMIAFVEGSSAPSSAPTVALLQEVREVNTDPTFNTTDWSLTVMPYDDRIEVIIGAADNRFKDNDAWTYEFQRSQDGGSYQTVQAAAKLLGSATYTYVDNSGVGNPCNGFRYKAIIKAFGKELVMETSDARITGAVSFTNPLKASKGEHANLVRLEWSVTDGAPGGVANVFRVFRKVANSGAGAAWTPLETVTSSSQTTYWSDNTALTGVYYDYRVTVYQTCSAVQTELASDEGIGFIQAFGTVSGRITYGTGSSVKDVNVLARRNDPDGENRYYSLHSTGGGQNLRLPRMDAMLSSTTDWTVQFWIFPDVTGGDEGVIARLGTQQLNLDRVAGEFLIHAGNTSSLALGTIPAGKWSHITITRSGNSWGYYAVNDADPANIVLDGRTVAITAASSTELVFGGITAMPFIGNIDDIRLWNRVLDTAEIRRDYSRRLAGNENGLAGYWPLDENLMGHAFDMSRTGAVYNGNHATRNELTFSENVPTEQQLGIRGITDANGNYQISGIPYQGEGTSYSIVPSMGVHQFSPTEQLRYISPSSMVHNSTDFTDISSFTVSGTVVYEGGTYPVEGCTFEIDGVMAMMNNQPVTSDADGNFILDVPIGVHTVQVKKNGHTFVDDGYLYDYRDDGSRAHLNYNAPLSGITFFNTTRVRLIGHIVGGTVEHEKASGFGLRTNNIGAREIRLTASNPRSYNLSTARKDTVFSHNTGDKWANWTLPGNIRQDQTEMSVFEKTVTITVSAETGEFSAWVYPEHYIIENISAGDYGVIYDRREPLDLRDAPVMDDRMLQSSAYSWPDSVFVPAQGNRAAYWEQVTDEDTVRYHKEWSYYYQAEPSFTIQQLAGNRAAGYFGDMEFQIDENTTVNLVTLEDGKPPVYAAGMPVFQQGEPYSFALSAFEEYYNPVTEVKSVVPVAGGTVSFSGELMLDAYPPDVELDSLGEGVFSFLGGMVDLTQGANELSAMIRIGGLAYYSETFGSSGLRAFVLGGRSTGTDFLTAAGDKIDFILHDPPGTSSYAFLEKGTSITKEEKIDWSVGGKFSTEMLGILGAKQMTVAGVGIMTGGETEITSKLGGKLEIETKYTGNRTITTKTTFTDRLETSKDPAFVGHHADIFVGTGMNTLYGLTNNVTIGKTADIGDLRDTIATFGDYAICKETSLSFGMSFGTGFYYTGHEIETIMIPKWKEVLRDLFVFSEAGVNTATIEYPVYVSKLPVGDPNFGKRNDDPVFGGAATNDLENGPSYKLILPDALRARMAGGLSFVEEAKGTIEVTDSVMHLNAKIRQWEEILADNEKRKVDAINSGAYKPGDNISFGSGVSIQRSTEFDSTYSTSHGFDLSEGVFIVTDNVLLAWGTGMVVKAEAGITSTQAGTWTDGDGTKHTVGFVLDETGDADQLTVDYTFDKKSIPATYMFRTRGGRTSCPYEGEDRTRYFEPGRHVFNEATMQIEVPKIAVSGGMYRLQVPSTRAASFTLDLTNESETGGTGWFKLTVDEKTNPFGAELKIDGLPIGNGRYFSVPSGSVLQKTLTLEKGPNEDLYEDIRLILASDCDTDLSDEIRITAEFMASCADVAFRSPLNNWIMNNTTGDSVMVELIDYDINYANFGYVELLYRLKSAPQWSTEMRFYADAERYEAAQGEKTLLGTDPFIRYWWRKDQKPDGEYEFAARAVCESGGTVIAEYTTPAVEGFVDMSRPVALGLPTPTSGIMGIGDELSIIFNEDIQTGLLTQNNFSITGVLNAQEIAEPDAGINFTGGTQLAKTELQIYTGGSFSIETWFKHDVGTAGTLFSYGTNAANSISLGFNATGHAVVKSGEDTYTSTTAIANDETWKYIALTYNNESNSVSVYEFEGATDNVLLADRVLTAVPPTQGQLTVGEGFVGAVAQLHFYGVNRTQADVSSGKSLTKSGMEHGLIGYWPMDEIEGTVAVDKARARNIVLTSADWYVYPSGRAMQTSNSSFAVNTSTYPLNAFSDFTLEFWFRSTAATNTAGQTLFSADNGYIATNATGGLTLHKRDSAGTVIRSLTATNLVNTRWQHIAMSVRRNGSVNVYINGALTSTFSESLLGTFSSGNFYFGAKRGATIHLFSDHFNGYFDEIRIWNSALTRESIVLNKNNKLRGDEAGLLAYYPFETYTKQSNGLITVTASIDNITDVVKGANPLHTITAAPSTATLPAAATIAVPVKDARPVENVPFSYVASSNRIVFTIDPTYFARVEGVTLTVAVQDVRDTRDNRSNTEQWTAYVRRNPLRWESDPVYLATEYGKYPTFTARISNTGGATASYSVVDLPTWLTVTNGSGSLAPLANRDLTFSVVSGTNIGSYETAVGLTSGNGVTEQLSVQLKVSGPRPDWEVNPNDFDGSMSVIGQIKINGVFSENTEDVLGAFIGDKCVGLASLTYISASNAYFVFADVYGNNEHGNQPVTFRLWDAASGRVYPKVETSASDIRFVSGSILGSAASPVVFNALDVYEQRIALRTGWNWVSANAVNDNPAILSQATVSLGNAGEIIKGQSSYIQRQPSGWIGTLSGISATSMYQVNVNRDVTLSVQGAHATPETPIAIDNGWNWIGYTPQAALPLQSALAGINAQVGDVVRGLSSYAVYLGAGGWAGTLTFMQPGSGYMYYSDTSAARTLVYPSNASQQQLAVQSGFQSAPPPATRWSVNPNEFSNSMTVTSVVLRGGLEIESDAVEIGAFSGDEPRGSALLQYVASEDKYIGFLIVYGEGSETITLKVYDHAEGKEYGVKNAPIVFSANAIYGTPEFYALELDVAVSYAVTVTGGTPSGVSFRAGDTVTITATVPAGQQFAGWTVTPAGVKFTGGTDTLTAVASFVMPDSAVTATASFEPVVVPPVTYTVTVEGGGRGSGTYAAGDTVIITSGRAPKGKRFDRWSSDDSSVAFTEPKSGKTTFVMPASDVTVTADFADYVTPKFVVSSTSKAAGGANVFVSGDPVAKASLAIFDATGNLVRKVSVTDDANADANANRAVATWDLKDSKGKPVAAGTYLLKGTVKTVDGKVSKVSALFGVN